MKALVGLLVVAGIGVGAFLLIGGESFGVGSDQPLGSLTEIEAWLREREFIRKELDPADLEVVFGEDMTGREGISAAEYLDHIPGLRAHVVIVTDEAGRLLGVGGHTRSGMLEYSEVGPSSAAFLAKYWVAISGAKPTFREEAWGTGDREKHLVARYRKGRVRGRWIKDWGGGIAIAARVTDRFAVVLE